MIIHMKSSTSNALPQERQPSGRRPRKPLITIATCLLAGAALYNATFFSPSSDALVKNNGHLEGHRDAVSAAAVAVAAASRVHPETRGMNSTSSTTIPQSTDLVSAQRDIDDIDENHLTTTQPTTLQLQPPDDSPLPICMDRSFFGRTNNRIIALARLLTKVYQEGIGRKVGLSKEWSDWYKLYFDDHDDIIHEHYPDNACRRNFTGRRAYHGQEKVSMGLQTLLPKKVFREEADRIYANWDYGKEFVSVHRRHLEGGCYIRATCLKKNGRQCLKPRPMEGNCTPVTRLAMCDMVYSQVVNYTDQPVVLFTDGQVPKFDDTFPHRFNSSLASSLMVEMMLMTKSSTHWGNPSSTVDVVVYHWRKGRSMMPGECVKSFDR